MKKEKFYKIDLHIHTPKSSDYNWKYQSIEEEYIGIIKEAKRSNLKIIAFTDHNSIEGYKEFLKIKNNFEKLKESKDFNNVENQDKIKLKKLIEPEIFNNILILPGIEFETKDSIHVLIIFNDKISINEIEDFLKESGYDKKLFGKKNPSKLSNWYILELFEKTKKYNCIVVDAHTDSNKGIYNLKPSKHRAECFKSDQLIGISYNNEITKDKLENIIKTSPDYKREKPVAFVKFSDSHSINEIGKVFTYFKLKKISFDSLKDAFCNPSGISVIIPETKIFLDKVINEKDSYGILDFSLENQLFFMKLLCALNNTEGGYCLFGLTDKKNKIGLIIDKNNTIDNYFDIIIECFKKIEGKIRPVFKIRELQKDKIIISIYVYPNKNLVNIKDENKIYLIRNYEIITANANSIQEIIENRQLNFIKTKVENKINNIENECQLIKMSLLSIPILKKIENKMRLLSVFISNPEILEDEKFSANELSKIKDKTDVEMNGEPNGNIIFMIDEIPARYDEAYLRVTPPMVKCKVNYNIPKNETIILAPGGAVFYKKNKPLFYSEKKYFVLIFNSKNKEYNNKFITAFLKSSFNIWYCLNKFENIDFFSKFEELEIPLIYSKNNDEKLLVKKIINRIDDIIGNEITFLKIIKRNVKLDEESRYNKINEYNSSVESLFYEIDNNIYKLLNLNDEDINVIKNYLKASKIYPFYKGNS